MAAEAGARRAGGSWRLLSLSAGETTGRIACGLLGRTPSAFAVHSGCCGDRDGAGEGRRWLAVLLASVCVAVRPTSAVLWLALGAVHLLSDLRGWRTCARFLFNEVLPIAYDVIVVVVPCSASSNTHP